MEKLGTVVALQDSPSTREFSFVMEKNNQATKKGQYVQIQKDENITLGYINEITKANRYFERAESVAEFEQQASMKDVFPVEDWEYTLACVKVLGAFSNGSFQRVYTPPQPGAKVATANNELLKALLGFEEDGLYIGNLQHHDITASLNMTKLLQKHFAILAMSGAGKSHLAAVLLEELLDRKKEDGRIALIVVDIHGEYTGFQNDEKYRGKTKVIEAKDICTPLRKLSSEQIAGWLPNLSYPQKELLRKATIALWKEKKKEGYGFKELFEEIDKESTQREDVKIALKRSLGELRRYRFLSKTKENPKLRQAIKPGEMLVLDFSEIDSLRKKQILLSLIGRRLFKLRKKEKIPPFLLLVEEAHNFAREKAEAYEAAAKSMIETVAREGRKFGASLCLVSQRPVNLSTTALSQCSTHIILRVTNPNDLDHIQMSSEGIDSRVVRNITGLQVGEAIIVGEAVRYPTFVNIRQRKSVKREKGLPLHEQAQHFEHIKEEKEKQVEAFL